MTNTEFIKLGKELQLISKSVPQHWGKIQNDTTDFKINLFECSTIQQLDAQTRDLSIEDQNYFKRRWFLWKCSQVDEYLFYNQNNIEKNFNPKDQSWDIAFNQSLKFDVKGTVVPKSLISTFSPDNEADLIEFYYNNQSRGVRNALQNRLFIVHHSFRKTERSIFLRCHWALKQKAFQEFNKRVTTSTINLFKYKSVEAKCIFIIESKENEFYYIIN